MSYSFVHPKPKKRIDAESRILFIFLLTTLVLIVLFSTFLVMKQHSLTKESDRLKRQTERLLQESKKYRQQIARIERLERKYETIQTNNTLLKESIHNLFDLIPDQITLTKAILDRDGLVLYGVTPSKDVYNYLLLAPLKSVFLKNVTTFYPLKNGWWRFVSINEGSIEGGQNGEEE